MDVGTFQPRAGARPALVVLAIVLAGCGGEAPRTPVEPPPPPPPALPAPARLQVRVVGSGYDIDLAGLTAALDSGTPRPVPAAGLVVFDSLAPGVRSVRLAGVGATCAVAGLNPRPLTLGAGQDTTLTFEVVCRTRVARVALARPYESVLAGDTLMLAATAYASDGSVLAGRPVTWATAVPATIAVTPSGVATGVGPGSARVTASVDGVEGVVEVTVFAPSTRAPRGFSYVADSSTGEGPVYRLHAVPADGSPVSTLGVPATFFSTYQWAPGGDQLLLTYGPRDGRQAGTYLLDVATGRERLMGALWGSYAWAPDGARIAYAAYDAATGGRSVEILDLRDGSTRVVLPSSGEVAGVSWSPDARRLAVLRRPVATGTDNPYAVWIVPIGAGEPRALTLPTRALHLSWAPDGRRLAFDDGTGFSSGPPSGVWIVDAEGRNARRLDVPCPAAIGTECETGYPSWSPDGRRIAVQQLPLFVTAGGRHVTFRGVDDGTLTTVLVGGRCCGALPPRWSADGWAVLLAAARPAPDYWPSVVRVAAGTAAGSTPAEYLTNGTNAGWVEWIP